MELRDGMLGVVIIAVAISVALFGSYLAGITPHDEEVTKYEYLADVSGLFDYDKSPQYVEFNPSTNFTGYYSEDSYSDFTNEYYFASNNVGFTNNQTADGKQIVNNYKIDIKPMIEAESQVDLSTLDATQRSGIGIRYVYDIKGDYVQWLGFSTESQGAITLKNLVRALDIADTLTNVTIRLDPNANWDQEPTQGFFNKTLTLNSVLVVPNTGSFTYVTSPNRDPSTFENLTINIQKPFMSVNIDTRTWNVKCYYSDDFSGTAYSYTADNLVVCFGNTDPGETVNYDVLNLGNLMTYATAEYYDPQYLDPKDGVHMEEYRCAVQIRASPAGYGYVSNPLVYVEPDTVIDAYQTTLRIGEDYIYTVPANPTAEDAYYFLNWTGIPENGKVTRSIVVTANYMRMDYTAEEIMVGESETLEYPINDISGQGHLVTQSNYVNCDFTIRNAPEGSVVQNIAYSASASGVTITVGSNVGPGTYYLCWETTPQNTTGYVAFIVTTTPTYFDVSILATPWNFGSVDIPSLTHIHKGTTVSASGNVLTIGDLRITATPRPTTANYNFAFAQWKGIPESGTITEETTIYAIFTRTTNVEPVQAGTTHLYTYPLPDMSGTNHDVAWSDYNSMTFVVVNSPTEYGTIVGGITLNVTPQGVEVTVAPEVEPGTYYLYWTQSPQDFNGYMEFEVIAGTGPQV